MNDFTENDYYLMDQYIHNRLSDVDRQSFEKRLINDPSLSAEVQWLQQLYVNYEQVRLEDSIRTIHQTLSEQGALELEPVVRPLWSQPLRVWLAVAASLVVVVGVGLWYWQARPAADQPTLAANPPASIQPTEPTTQPNPGHQSIGEKPVSESAEFVKRYANALPKGIGTVPDALHSPVTDYEQGRLNPAIAALRRPLRAVQTTESIPEFGASPDQSTSGHAMIIETPQVANYRQFYLGLSYLKNSEPRRALNALEQVNSTSLTPAADWYRALCYLKLKQNDQAKAVLKSIENKPQHPYQAEAGQLITTLADHETNH